MRGVRRLINTLGSLLCLCVLSKAAYASALSNISVGFDIGGGINYYRPSTHYITTRHPDHASFAWGLHIADQLSQRTALELGYLNFGFYENYGDGFAYCDPNHPGECYTHPQPGTLPAHLNVNNDISNQAFYFAFKYRYPLGHQYLFAKVGAAYVRSKIEPRVTVDAVLSPGLPVGYLLPDQNETITNHNKINPFLALGWAYPVSKTMTLFAEIDAIGWVNMYRADGTYDGRFIPASIMMGLSYNL